MDSDNDALMGEPEAHLGQREAGMAGGATGGDLSGDVVMGPPEGCAPASGIGDAEFRSTNENRGQGFEPTANSVNMPIDGSQALLPAPSSLSSFGGDGPDLTEGIREAVKRSVLMCQGGEGAPVASGKLAVASEPTVAVVCVAWRAANEASRSTFTHSTDGVHPLDKEEVAGYLAGDLLGREILPEEARKLGASVRKAAEKAKAAEAKEKGKAQVKRSKTRSAAAANDARAAGLAQQLADIDAVERSERATHYSQPVSLNGLPAAKTVVAARSQPKAVTPEAAAAKAAYQLEKLRKAAAAAEESVMLAEADAVAARRMRDSASATLSQVDQDMAGASRAQVWAPLETEQSELDTEWQEWVEVREKASASAREAFEGWKHADKAHLAAIERAEEARWAVEAEEDKCAAERAGEQRASEAKAAREAAQEKTRAAWAAEAEAAEKTAAEARTAEAAALARIAVIEARIAELELAERAKTRARLHADAKAAWGPDWQSKSPTAVYKL